MNKPASTDDQSDAPVISHALGCRAQRLFLNRDYAGLQSLLSAQESNLDDLPDGSSGMEAAMGGLDDLLSYGGLSIDQMMDRTAQWRLAYPQSVYPEFAETSALLSWAYYARGFGTANTINGQNLQLFTHRVSMADSSLQDLEAHGKSSPLWYELSLTVGLLKSTDQKALRTIFEEGISRFPEHHALYGKMLHVLMPRWLGSPADVAGFIYDQAQKEGKTDRADQRYAELLFAYSTLEQDEVDIFQQENAQWDALQWGLAGLIKRYPHTDVYRNALAKFACEKQDWPEYRVFSRRYPAHYSASVWSQKLSIDSCNLGASAAAKKQAPLAPEAP